MDIKERLEQNMVAIQQMQTDLAKLEQSKQEILQEMLRLDGENRLLRDMEVKDGNDTR